MVTINKRFALEGADETSMKVVDLFRQTSIGDFWKSPTGAWAFQLDDGRSRFGGYVPVLRSLRLMLKAARA